MARAKSGGRPALPFAVELPESTEHLNMIIYGDTGVGKTTLLGTASEYVGTDPLLLIDIEGGTKSLHGKQVDVVRPKMWREIQEIYNYLRHENTHYKAVAIDSLTELQRKHSMGSIMGDLDAESDEYGDLEKAISPTRQDWLRTGEQMRKFIRAFRDLSYLSDRERRVHVIMTALEKYDEKKDLVCPQLPGALGLECGAFVDILGRLSIVSREVDMVEGDEGYEEGAVKVVTARHLLTAEYVTEEGMKYKAKNRGGLLGQQVWNPTITSLIGVWDGTVEAAQ